MDDYQLELTWDYGLVKRLDWTANISYDYRNFTDIGADIRGGRFANQFEYQFGSKVLHDPLNLRCQRNQNGKPKRQALMLCRVNSQFQ